MTNYSAPVRDMRFVAYEVFNIIEELNGLEGHEELSEDLLDAILDECAKISENILAELNQSGDHEGCRIENSQVVTPKGFKAAYQEFARGGWCGLTAPNNYGGQGLPETFQYLVDEIISSGNLSFGLYPGLTQGTIICLLEHGTEEQKNTYLPKLISGEWQGTMCLTESHAGSDLGLLKAKAESNGDGSYRISGTKIFISAGDHDMVDNIIHLVLARLPDAPEGSRGISMFLVPKRIVSEHGNLAASNTVSVGSLESKMGMKASATCVMNFDGATGWIVGAEHKGLAGMFTMMNKERLFVGTQGISQAELAYQKALAYSKDRVQGRRPDGKNTADPIIVHPDIRNKLLYAKAIVEAQRALAVWTHLNVDRAHRHSSSNVRRTARNIESLMTPVIKAACTDNGTAITNMCLQVFGGHGYVTEWGMEQLIRDVRVTQIYEGTNAIQALDLVSRKLSLNDGELFTTFMEEVRKSIAVYADNNDLRCFIDPFLSSLEQLEQVTVWLGVEKKNDPNLLGSIASDYLQLFSVVSFAWMWILMAAKSINTASGEDVFYLNKISLAKYFYDRILPSSGALITSIYSGSESIMSSHIESL